MKSNAKNSALKTPPKMQETSEQEIQRLVQLQKREAREKPAPTAAERRQWLDTCIGLLVDHKDEIADALDADFGNRSRQGSLATDIGSTIGSLKFCKKNLKKWMRPSKRSPMPPLGLFGARAWVEYQPYGCVGNVVPWNFPFNLAFGPLASIFAAGNRCLLKPSEYTPHCSILLKGLVEKYFDEEVLAVVTGGPEVGAVFTRQPFDHLLFTGATAIAHHVMRAAAENLVPLTLELGGKSPVIVSRKADMKKTAARVMTGKTLNAGQICLAPDYVMVPKDKVQDFVEEAKNSVSAMFPTMKDNPDYTSVVSQRHYERLNAYLEEVKQKGGTLVEINPAKEDFSQQAYHKIPPTIVVEPQDDWKVMQEEIFGPILPVKAYDKVEEAIDYVNQRPRPLGLYYFGNDSAEEKEVLSRTTSGGVTVNDVVTHVMQEEMPFGGVGPSGMGSYHGYEGFVNFSHAKSTFRQSPLEFVAGMLRPPYGKKIEGVLSSMIKK